MTRFVEYLGEKYRVLCEDEVGGAWLIDYNTPGEPVYVSCEIMPMYQRIETPLKYVEQMSGTMLSEAKEKRLALIRPLLNDPDCIRNRSLRRTVAKTIAEKEKTTARRVLRVYYRYLATGVLVDKKEKKQMPKENFDWAIRTFYYSAKKFSLKAVYDMMLLERYSDERGVLLEDRPTFDSFRHYFYRKNYHKEPQKIISRDGLTYYLRNMRPMYGSASNWREQVGSYQMDATLADIYLVSRSDRSVVIGRPYVYLAVDTATQLIAGIYVGMDAGEGAVLLCLAQAAEDKVGYCKKFGIEINGNEWPSRGLPYEIVADKGREFFGRRMMELCMRYGIDVQTLPPFRPDQKGLVEKAFDLLQTRYKPYLRGKGVIEPDAGERWAVDYREQAVLDIDEFTKIIIHCILYLNGGRVLRKDGETPASRWLKRSSGLLDIDVEMLRKVALPRQTAKLTRKGLTINKLTYAPESMEGLYIGSTYEVAYSEMDMSKVYIVLSECYRTCHLIKQDMVYEEMNLWEAEKLRQKRIKKENAAKKEEVETSVASIRNIKEVIAQATQRTKRATIKEEL